ncbi:unnamed protein product [Oncorhynchus mykiss]|uniref:Cadherin domain-containing protein n=1 Tax=Oncorhynchus mykiss TaxID=8022 RepID=A0A060VXM3_ONCMY|nr:unnamed protein product [Oncorhynchus mykiss]
MLPLEVIVEHPLQLHRIDIDIQDLNDNSPSFLTNERFFKIAESITAGAKFTMESAHDPDVASNSLRSYSVSDNDTFLLNVKTQDGTKIPELVQKTSLDREKKAVHKLVLTAVDGGNPARSGTSEITVIVLDINDNAPQFEIQFYDVSVAENTPVGTTVLNVRATDSDQGLNGVIEYLFADQTPDTIMSLLDVDFNTGDITIKGQLDYEQIHLHKFDMMAKDKGNPQMEGQCSIKIKIADVNDNAPENIITSLTSPIPENSSPGMVIALISAKDLDGGENGKVKLIMTPGSPFTLKPSVSNHYALLTNGPLDRETFPEYDVVITAVDSGYPPLSTKKTVTVEILDVNYNPPVFSQPSYTVYVKENGTPASILRSVSASDTDMGENAKISYSILDSKVQDVSVSSYMYINSDNGSIYSMHSQEAKDHGSPSLSSNAIFVSWTRMTMPPLLFTPPLSWPLSPIGRCPGPLKQAISPLRYRQWTQTRAIMPGFPIGWQRPQTRLCSVWIFTQVR